LFDGREPVHWPEFGIPLLVAEVLSPSTAKQDRITKRRRYQRSGVQTCWIVDLDARLVEVWRATDARPEIRAETLEWLPDAAEAALVVDLPRLCRNVWGERAAN